MLQQESLSSAEYLVTGRRHQILVTTVIKSYEDINVLNQRLPKNTHYLWKWIWVSTCDPQRDYLLYTQQTEHSTLPSSFSTTNLLRSPRKRIALLPEIWFQIYATDVIFEESIAKYSSSQFRCIDALHPSSLVVVDKFSSWTHFAKALDIVHPNVSAS